MTETTVVNRRNSPFDQYIGRGSGFGNPYEIGINGTREEVIYAYSLYFRQKLKSDPTFHSKVMALEGLRLGCSCKSRACHGDVIKQYIETGNV